MAVPGPTDRKYEIDDSGAAVKDWTPLVVGEPSGIGALEAALHELTGPGDINPKFLPAGFIRGDDMTFVFQADVGGAAPADPTAEFHVDTTTSRTITITFVAAWTFPSEAYVKKVTPKTSPEQLSLLEVTFTLTGAQTVT